MDDILFTYRKDGDTFCKKWRQDCFKQIDSSSIFWQNSKSDDESLLSSPVNVTRTCMYTVLTSDQDRGFIKLYVVCVYRLINTDSC